MLQVFDDSLLHAIYLHNCIVHVETLWWPSLKVYGNMYCKFMDYLTWTVHNVSIHKLLSIAVWLQDFEECKRYYKKVANKNKR